MKVLLAVVPIFSVLLATDAYINVGDVAKNRKELDGWSNAVYIPNPKQPINMSGTVTQWSFYARRTGLIYLQIWRRVNSYRFRLVGQERVPISRTGVLTVSAASRISVRRGDLLGFYFPRSSIIPFDGIECYTQRGLYYKRYSTLPLRNGMSYSFRTMQRGWKPCREYSLTARVESDAEARPTNKTKVQTGVEEAGNAVIPREDLDKWRSSMYIPEPFKPLDAGHLQGWKIYAARGGEIFLQVWRPAGSTNRYRLVGQTEYDVDKAGVHDISLNNEIKVEDGDVIGFFFPGQSIIPFDGEECYTRRTLYVKYPSRSSVRIGATFTFSRKISGWNPCRKYSILAQIRTLNESGSGGSGDDGESGDGSGAVTSTSPTTTLPITTESMPENYREYGFDVKDRTYLDKWLNAVFIPSPKQPIKSNGTLVRWAFYARRTGLIYLQIWRKYSFMRYKLIGQQRVIVNRTGAQLVKADKTIRVASGDMVGFHFPSSSIIPFDGQECYYSRGYYIKKYFRTALIEGHTYSFRTQQRGWNPCRQYSLKVGITETESEPTTLPTTSEYVTTQPVIQETTATNEINETVEETGSKCCWEKSVGKALIGKVLAVVPASEHECKFQCCHNNACLSFSSSQIAGQSFCVLQQSRITSSALVKNDPKFNHYDKKSC